VAEGETAGDPWLSRTFDGYRTEERIGEGGMGSVYRATQLSLNRPVAIKVLPEEMVGEFQARERFRREADALSKLQHPNIVSVFDRGEVDLRPYLVMEYVHGTNLRAKIEEGPMAPGRAIEYVNAILAALDHAHELGIVHRDIKPENVLITTDGVVKVVDFGLGRFGEQVDLSRLTHSLMTIGTPEYMSPEQREKSKEADARSDLFATGVVFYEMLTGELPIGRFKMPSERRPEECDKRLDSIVRKSLQKDPAERYESAEEMGRAITEISEQPSAAAEEPPLPRTAPGAARFEQHIDLVATLDQVLGTIFLAVGLLSLFWGAFQQAVSFGIPFFVFLIAGWYCRKTGTQVKSYNTEGRSKQALVAVLAGCTVLMLPLSVYSLWVLFSPRGRVYYDARGRGLEPAQAAGEVARLAEVP
jgi:serine/threonine protein kinase